MKQAANGALKSYNFSGEIFSEAETCGAFSLKLGMDEPILFVVNDPGNVILEFWSLLFLLRLIFSIRAYFIYIYII